MLAPDIIKNTDNRKFIEFIEFFNTQPVQFIHVQFTHKQQLWRKITRIFEQ